MNRTYLLLNASLQKEGKYEAKLGFEKPFAATSKPQPRRLALTSLTTWHGRPAHETGQGRVPHAGQFKRRAELGGTRRRHPSFPLRTPTSSSGTRSGCWAARRRRT